MSVAGEGVLILHSGGGTRGRGRGKVSVTISIGSGDPVTQLEKLDEMCGANIHLSWVIEYPPVLGDGGGFRHQHLWG